MRWPGHVARIGEMRNYTYAQLWSENLKGRDHSEDVGVNLEGDNIRMFPVW